MSVAPRREQDKIYTRYDTRATVLLDILHGQVLSTFLHMLENTFLDTPSPFVVNI